MVARASAPGCAVVVGRAPIGLLVLGVIVAVDARRVPGSGGLEREIAIAGQLEQHARRHADDQQEEHREAEAAAEGSDHAPTVPDTQAVIKTRILHRPAPTERERRNQGRGPRRTGRLACSR